MPGGGAHACRCLTERKLRATTLATTLATLRLQVSSSPSCLLLLAPRLFASLLRFLYVKPGRLLVRAQELLRFFQRPLSLARTELRLLPSPFFGVQGLLCTAPRLPFGSYRLRPLQSLAMRNLRVRVQLIGHARNNM